MLSKIFRFFTHMDARAARAVAIAAILLFSVVLIVLMGQTTAIFDEDDAPVFNWLREFAESPWSLPATVAVFVAASFIAAPQSILIGAAVSVFGPTNGFLYSWIATMASSTVNFALARRLGADVLKRYGGEAVARISALVGENGFWTSMGVRMVPTGPFILVNMALGVSKARPSAFLAGTAIGIIPKIAMFALVGAGLIEVSKNGSLLIAAGFALAAGIWFGGVVLARRALQKRIARRNAVAAQEDQSGSPG